MSEIWKDIEGYEGLYQVSNLGRVRSLYYQGHKREKILKTSRYSNDYLKVTLCKNSDNHKDYMVHRLVAQAFIPNTNNYPQINHIDSNRQNNCVSNLEWCTASQNIKHAYVYGNRKPVERTSLSKIVKCLDLNGNLLKVYPTIAKAKEDVTGVYSNNNSSIHYCCLHKKNYHTAYGYKWEYGTQEDLDNYLKSVSN